MGAYCKTRTRGILQIVTPARSRCLHLRQRVMQELAPQREAHSHAASLLLGLTGAAPVRADDERLRAAAARRASSASRRQSPRSWCGCRGFLRRAATWPGSAGTPTSPRSPSLREFLGGWIGQHAVPPHPSASFSSALSSVQSPFTLHTKISPISPACSSTRVELQWKAGPPLHSHRMSRTDPG
jgi:hypothetical protein